MWKAGSNCDGYKREGKVGMVRGHIQRKKTENVTEVSEIKVDRKRPRGRPNLRWKDTVRRDTEFDGNPGRSGMSGRVTEMERSL